MKVHYSNKLLKTKNGNTINLELWDVNKLLFSLYLIFILFLTSDIKNITTSVFFNDSYYEKIYLI